MSDYEKAVEAATRAGFHPDINQERLYFKDCDLYRELIHIGNERVRINMNIPLSDFSALLNPITPEQVEKAVRDNLLGWLNENAVIDSDDVDDLVGDILVALKGE